MRNITRLLAGAALALAVAPVSANAAIFNFDLSGSRNASFQIDSDTAPDFFSSSSLIGDQVRFDDVAGIFAGVAGTGSIGFGTNLAAALNINGTPLGFTQFVGPALFSGTPGALTFNTGTFALTSIVSGSSTLTISLAGSAIPEPATWAMLILGFGAVGTAARRRAGRGMTANA